MKQLDGLITTDIIDVPDGNLTLIDSCCAIILDASKNFYDESDYIKENANISFAGLTARLNIFIENQLDKRIALPKDAPHLAHVVYTELTKLLEQNIFDAFHIFFLTRLLRKIIKMELYGRKRVQETKDFNIHKRKEIKDGMRKVLMDDLASVFDLDELNKGCESNI